MLLDEDGNARVRTFRNKRVFEQWAGINDIISDGQTELVKLWEDLEDGGFYSYATTPLQERVRGVNLLVHFQ